MTSCRLSINIQQPYTIFPQNTLCILQNLFKCLVAVVFQSLSHVQLFVTPWIPACQASLSYTISKSLLTLTFIELLMPPKHLILCCPLLLLPSIFHSIRVFSKEMAFSIKQPKYWSFSFISSPSNEYSGLVSFIFIFIFFAFFFFIIKVKLVLFSILFANFQMLHIKSATFSPFVSSVM